MIELEVNNPNENQRAPYDEAYLIPVNNSVDNPHENQRASDDEAYLTPVNNSVDVNNGSVHYYSTADLHGRISQHATRAALWTV